MAEERVRLTIELPRVDVPVIGFLLVAGSISAAERGYVPVYQAGDYLSDLVIARELDVDPSGLSPDDLMEYLGESLRRILSTDDVGSMDLDERFDVEIVEVGDDS